jgi:hypothetical protein
MGQIVRSGEFPRDVRNTIERLSILGSGKSDSSIIAEPSDLVSWWMEQ